jgi:hypothetical protein
MIVDLGVSEKGGEDGRYGEIEKNDGANTFLQSSLQTEPKLLL